MKNAIASGLKHISRVQVVLVVLGTMGMIYATSANLLIFNLREASILPAGFHILHIFSALQSDTVASLLPIIAALPYAGKFIDDVKSKFARFLIIRIGYSTYLFSRIVVCYMLSGLIILAGVACSCFVSTIVFLPIEKRRTENINLAFPLLSQCVLLLVNGGFWATLGMTMSTVMESKYIAYASPFVAYYLLVMLCERYFPNAYLIYPHEWLNPSAKWPMGTWGVVIFLLELTALLGLVFYRRGKRRLEQL